MHLTKEQALAIGFQVMKDIKYDHWDKEDKEGPNAILIDTKKDPFAEEDYWLVSFPFGKEDYGENERYLIEISSVIKIAKDISYRNGHINLGYNVEDDKYFIEERRP